MKIQNKIQIIAMGLFIIFCVSFAWASSANKTFVFEPMKKHQNASGTALIDKNHISLQARGLKAEAVYTVWFVNMKPNKKETGAGSAPFMFQTDQWGNGSYSAPLANSPFGKWSMIMVVQHPNGDPKDMKHMVGALKAVL